jgi:short-subunit dehydrogenase
MKAHGPIDVLVNNAGVMDVGATPSFDLKVGRRLMDLDLISPMLLVQSVLPGMLERGRGSIINIISVAGIIPMPGATWYSAAKAGLGAYSESLRAELRGTGVKILTVYPGPVDTALAQSSLDAYGEKGPAGMLPKGSPQALAGRVRAAMERGRARVIYPRLYTFAYWFPRLCSAFVALATPKLPAGKTFSLPGSHHVE